MNLINLRQQVFDSLRSGNVDTACEALCKIAISTNMAKHDCWNIAFVAFKYASLEMQEYMYKKLIVSNIGNLSDNYKKWLLFSFELNLQKENVEEKIQDFYINTVIRPNTYIRPGRSIVHWHIPKCSGTSITEALGRYYYKLPVPELIPGYAFKPLLVYLARERLSEFPYFSSMHLDMKELSPKTGFFGFAILRDPVKRCLSMYRQQYEGNKKQNFIKYLAKQLIAKLPNSSPAPVLGLYYHQILPRYGWFWDYTKDANFGNWKNNIPKALLMRQLTTFSGEFNVDEAAENIKRQDYVIMRDYNIGSDEKLLSLLDIPIKSISIPKKMNKSNSRIKIEESMQAQLKEDLELEYKLLYQVRLDRS